MLPTNLGDRAIAAQPGQHDLDLLLRRPTPVLPLLAQPLLPSVERPMLSRPPDSPSGATRLRDCPAPQPSHLSTQDRGAGQQSPFSSERSERLLLSAGQSGARGREPPPVISP